MKAEMEKAPVENQGIDVTSETEEERLLLEGLWTGNASALMLTRNDDRSVTLTFAPIKER